MSIWEGTIILPQRWSEPVTPTINPDEWVEEDDEE